MDTNHFEVTDQRPETPLTTTQNWTNGEILQSWQLKQDPNIGIHVQDAIQVAWAVLLGIQTAATDVSFDMTRVAPEEIPECDEGKGKHVGDVTNSSIRVRLDRNSPISSLVHQFPDTCQPVEDEIGITNSGGDKDCKDTARGRAFLEILHHEMLEDTISEGSFPPTQPRDLPAKVGEVYLGMSCTLSKDNKLNARIIFDARTFSPGHAQHRLSQFHQIIQVASSTCPSRPQRLLYQAGSTDLDMIKKSNLGSPSLVEQGAHTLVAQHAAKSPEAAAISAWDGDLSYRELDTLATVAAEELATLGVGPEIIVPLRFERSKWAVVAILAVVKAGAAFIFVDVDAPSDRSKYILDKLDTDVMLTTQNLLVPEHLDKRKMAFIDIMAFKRQSPGQDGYSVSPNVDSSNALYCIFTSGTTGRPKGSVITHGAFCTSALSHGPAMAMGQDSRVFHFSSYTFDGAVLETLTTLVLGGCICIPSESERLSDSGRAMTELKANWAVLTPSVARVLEPQSVPSLRHLVLAGEAVSQADLDKWNPNVQVIIGYGPSECSIISHAKWVTSTKASPACLGWPVSCAMWIVDPEDSNILLPIGTEGEIVLEGEILGRGYFKDDEKTAQAFFHNPLWAQPGVGDSPRDRRFYKTGDIGKYTSNMELLFVGRKDNQVKLRGQRIEMEEVESQLSKVFPDRKIVVDVFTPVYNPSASPILAVFIAPLEKEIAIKNVVDTQDLKVADEIVTTSVQSMTQKMQMELKPVLPRYMIPSMIIPLEAIPVTTSGKTNRRSLRQFAQSLSEDQILPLRLQSHDEKRQPSCHVESKMQKIWADVLNIDQNRIGLDDHFFHLGGDSILAMKLVSTARSSNLHFHVQDVFRQPVLESLAKCTATTTTNTLEHRDSIDPFSLIQSKDGYENILQVIMKEASTAIEEIVDVYPSTPLQEGLMLLSMKDPGSYITQEVYKLPIGTDVNRLKRAWEQVVKEAAIWRTSLVQVDDRMYQVVMRDTEPFKHSTNLADLLESETSQPIGFGDSLCRTIIVEQTDVKYLVLTIHHALYDAWSLSMTLDRVSQAYIGEPELQSPIEFNVFIDHLESLDNELVPTFWGHYLSDVDQPPFPASLSATKSPQPDREVETHLEWRLNAQSRHTLSTWIRAAWALLIRSYTSSRDVVFGSTLSGRNAPVENIAAILGPTITSVPVRIRQSATATVESFLDMIQEDATTVMPFEQAGLQYIQGLSDDCRRACAFNNFIIVQQPGKEIGDSARKVFGEHIKTEDPARFNSYLLMLEVWPIQKEIKLKFSFDQRAIDEPQIYRLSRQFDFILQTMSKAKPQTLLENFPIVNPIDLHEIHKWNGVITQPTMVCSHHVIEKQAIQRSNATAVSAWDGNLTFSELDKLASALALRLREFGVGPDVMVPVCLEKTKWAVVAMLGVLKAGGAFVPLDPAIPHGRAAVVCGRVGATIGLTSKLTEKYFDSILQNTLIVDAETLSRPWYGSFPALQSVTPSNIMYVVFTSGSTGTPKGCVIEHGAFMSASVAVSKAHLMDQTSRNLQFSSFSFDSAIEEIFTTLAIGACVCVPGDMERVGDITLTLQKYEATMAQLTPTVASMVDYATTPKLQVMVLLGERIQPSLIERNRDHVHFINSYGLSECAVTNVISSVVSPECPDNIGWGVGCTTWIVDRQDHDKLVPIGAEGELLIEGPVLAREYLGEPELTAAAFIYDPKWAESGNARTRRRFYKTGDIVRYDPNGSIVYVHRKDTQLKIYGQRVEVDEIENQLNEVLASTEVSVDIVHRYNDPSVPTLAAFIVLNQAETEIAVESNSGPADITPDTVGAMKPLVARAETHLSSVLPRYMMPSMFIPVKQIPLTISGKTDRHRLRAIGSSLTHEQIMILRTVGGTKEGPSNPIEEKIQSLWAEVLKLEKVSIGIRDNFFRLGGDSVAAMRLVAAARQMHLSISIADIFQQPTLAKMSSRVKHQEFGSDGGTENSPLPFCLVNDRTSILAAIAAKGIPEDDVVDAYPCTAIQEGLMTLSAKHPGSYIATEVYELNSSVNLETFREAWTSLVNLNPIWRTRIVLAHNEMYQVVLKAQVDWQLAPTLTEYLSRGRDSKMGLGTTLTGFAIVQEPTSTYFVLTVHHSLYDSVSLKRSFDDVIRIYHSLPPMQNVGFNCFVQHLLTDLDERRASDFWARYLLDSPTETFPSTPSNTVPVNEVACISETIAWRKEGIDGKYTLSTILKAAWALTLSSYTAMNDIIFGLTLSGRNAPVPNIDRIMGPTITTLPVRVQLSSQWSISTLLECIQQDSIDMIPFEHFGLQRISLLNSGTKASCNFNNLLIIQTDDITSNAIENTFGPRVPDKSTFSSGSYGLVLECIPKMNELAISTEFKRTDLDAPQVRRILRQFGHYLRVLSSMKANTLLTDLPRVSSEDLNEIQGWNTERETQPFCVHHLIHDRTTLQPHANAICAWDGTMTYEDLDTQSSRVSRILKALEVGPEYVVPVCVEKSKWSVVALLGVVKAGAAFVAVDTTLPKDRIINICEQIKPRVGLTSSNTTGVFGSLVGISIAIDQADLDILESLPAKSHTDHSNMMYIVFTSGSTGRPKGCIIEHKSYVTSALAMGRELGLNADSRMFQFSSFSFDVAFEEIFTTLIFGGCICIPSEAERLDSVSGAINKYEANIAEFTPSVAQLIDFSTTPTLRQVILGGEAVRSGDVARIPSSIIIKNCYGLSESAISNTLSRGVRPATPGNVGYTIGCNAWVVSPDNVDALLPIGSEGELLLEGPILARGYLGDPEKTEQVFISSPKWARDSTISNGSSGRTFYRTGDIFRYASDGSLIYVGRNDSQIKINGQRVELEDIETHIRAVLDRLVAVEAIQTPCHTADSVEHRTSSLYAFVSSKAAGGVYDIEEVLDFSESAMVHLESVMDLLERKLSTVMPRHMHPSTYIPLKCIPLAASGKTDRRMLSKLVSNLSSGQNDKFRLVKQKAERPETAAQKQMCRLWSAVLMCREEDIGINSNFFRLGGNSMSAIKLMDAARAIGLSLTVAQVFQEPVLANLTSSARLLSDGPNHFQSRLEPFQLVTNSDGVFSAAADVGLSLDQIKDAYPCTSLQEGMMWLSLQDPCKYISREVYQLPDNIDLPRFRRAWDLIIESNPIWTTRLIHTDNKSYQIVLKSEKAWCMETTPEGQKQEQNCFQVSYGAPLAMYGACQTSAGVFFYLTAHHALYDAYTIPVTLKAAMSAYYGKPIPITRNFNTFIQYTESLDVKSAEQFWTEYLDGIDTIPYPALPNTSFARPDSNLQETMPFKWAGLGNYTPSTLIKAAWAVTIGRQTNSADIIFGVVSSGRGAPVEEINDILGPTIATVPTRIRLNWEQGIEEFLANIQTDSTELIKYEQTGLQKTASITEFTRESCKFNTLLVIQAGREEDATGDNAFFRFVKEPKGGLEFESYALSVECHLEGDNIGLFFTFDSCTISVEQVKRLSGQLQFILRELATADRESSIRSISGISPEDQATVEIWNQLPQTTFHPESVHGIILKHAQSYPDSPAVWAWDGSLTYNDLEIMSTTLASQLQDFGVRRGAIVPISFEKSKFVPVVLLGVLKAGGAFVCIDPTYPRNRVAHICAQTQATVGITSQKMCMAFHNLGITSITVDESTFNTTLSQITSAVGITTAANDAMYVIYTSGSTGVPKGCVVEHGSYLSEAIAIAECLHIENSTRMFQFASYTFDTALEEIFTVLISGGCICIPSDAERLNDLETALTKYEANTTELTASVAALIDFSKTPTLQKVILGGEAISLATVSRHHLNIEFYNTYGLSECSITSTACKVSLENPISIGHPVGCKAWVVDPCDSDILLPIGAEGELLIEGHTLARHYLNEPEKTSEAFISNPKWASSDDSVAPRRFYKTGDLVKYADNGEILFLGRRDTQVKLHGQRIEVAEIESQLATQLQPYFVAVDMVNLRGYSKSGSLVAFVGVGANVFDLMQDFAWPSDTLITSMASAVGDAKNTLLDLLPRYMHPTVYIPLGSIPLTVSGKVDRRRLKDYAATLDHQQLLILNGPSIPMSLTRSDPQDLQMQNLWAGVLSVPAHEIRLSDNFFHLGGDSMSAMRLVTTARKAGLSITVADIFKNPQLHTLVQNQKTVKPDEGPEDSCPEEETGISTAEYALAGLPRSRGISAADVQYVIDATDFQMFVLAHGQLPNHGFISYFTLSFDRVLDRGKLQSACQRLVAHHDILRMAFSVHDRRVLQVCLKNPVTVPNIHYATETMDDACHTIIAKDRNEPLRVGDAIVSFYLVRGPDQDRLIIRLSHAHFDGMSLPTIFNDLSLAYQSKCLSNSPGMSYFTKIAIDKEDGPALSYWRQLLDGSEVTRLTKGCSPHRFSTSDKTIQQTIQTVSLRHLGITFASILKAAWAVVLGSVASCSDVVFGHMISGRNIPAKDIDRIVGPCVNIIPVRYQIGTSVFELLEQVQEQQVSSMPFETLGFQTIIDRCTAWPSQTRFSTIVQHQNLDDTAESFLFDGSHCKVDQDPGSANAADAWVISEPRGELIDVSLCFPHHNIPETLAEELLNGLCKTILSIAARPQGSIDEIKPPPSPHEQRFETPTEDNFYPMGDVREYVAIVKDAWIEVAGGQLSHDRHLTDSTSIFELWDNFIVASQLSLIYEQRGFDVGMDEVLQHHTLLRQAALLWRTHKTFISPEEEILRG